jgi:dihydrodipicolinate synthase/N-acetylneuraminate lyase
VCEAAAAADLGIIVYNTFWTSAGVSFRMVEKLTEIPNVVGLKWPVRGPMPWSSRTSSRPSRIGSRSSTNHLMFAQSHMLGARAFEGSSLQLLAGMGHPPDRQPRGRPLP